MSFLAHEAEELSSRDRWLPSPRQARLVAMWCGLYLLYATLGQLYSSLWLLVMELFVWLAALILLVLGLLHLRMLRRVPVAVLLTVALLPAAALLVTPALHRFATWSAFELRRDEFQAVIDVVESGRIPRRGRTTARGIPYIIDEGPPRRIAFQTHPGVVDNWSGVVYDPTHAVAATMAHSGRDKGVAVPEEVRELFGGDIVSCRLIDDSFYRCGFT